MHYKILIEIYKTSQANQGKRKVNGEHHRDLDIIAAKLSPPPPSPHSSYSLAMM